MPLQIIRQDITKMQVDAIVNPTNEQMIGYSGVDLAIHTGAGQKLDAACAEIAPIGPGQAKITRGYGLPCRYVIHTVGPVWQGGGEGESDQLRSCYAESLKLAVANECESVAFPLISSGAYGYPKDQVLRFAVSIITEFLFEHELTVYLCVYDRESYSFSQKLFLDIKDFIGADEIAPPIQMQCRMQASYKQTPCAPSPRRKRMEELAEKSCCIERQEEMDQAGGGPIAESLYEYLKQQDKGFREMLFDLIDERGMTDVECYKKANVDKRTFSKIKSNKDYRPSKQTIIAFAISLQLSLDQTQELLATVGFTLSRSSVFDKIILYFIHNENYDIFEINQALFEFDQTLLGV